MTAQVIALATGVLVLAGFAQGLTGFGFGLVAMGLLPHVLGLDQAQAVATIAGMAAFIAMTGATLRHVQWSSVGHILLSIAVGVPLGYTVLAKLPQSLVMRSLGATICGLVLFEVLVTRRYAVRLPTWTGWLIGLFSGSLSGAFNIGGPPLVAYVYDRPWPKQQQVATLSGLFLVTGFIRLALMHTDGHLTSATWTAAAWAIGPMAAAILLGNRLLRYVPQDRLRTGIYVVLMILGARYLIMGS